MSKNAYSELEQQAIYRAIFERRDMRHFIPGELPEGLLSRLLEAASAAPSVGYMQPWRFIHIKDSRIRGNIKSLVEEERIATAKALNTRHDEFMTLKVEGIQECAEVLVVCLSDEREKHVFGRRTLPQMDLASVSCAIQNMWLAARAEGIGIGWVSLFCPKKLGDLLHLPDGAEAIAVLCIGPVDKFYDLPMLEEQGWDKKRAMEQLLMTDCWEQN